MSSALKVGLTGGIGSGKSIVAKIFKVLGIPCYDSDLHARTITETSFEVREKIISRFGTNSYLPSGEYNRKEMAERVFNDSAILKELNAIVHPALESDFNSWYTKYANLPFVLKEAALLYETGSFKQLDKMIVVSAPEGLRMQRTLLRDPNRSQTQIENIIRNQWREDDKVQLADFLIINDDTELIIPQIINIYKQLIWP